MGEEVRLRRLWVGRSLRSGRPVAADDITLAIGLAKDKSRRLKVAYVQGLAFVTMMANALWSMVPWSLAEVLMLVAGVVSLGVFLVGIAYGMRVQRWLRRNS